MRNKFPILMVCALALVGPAVGRADVITVGPAAPIYPGLTDWTKQLIFPQFDASLGTLQEVELLFEGTINTTMLIANRSVSTSTGRANTHVEMYIDFGSQELCLIDLISPRFDYILPAGGTVTSGVLSQSGSFITSYFSPADLATFIGPGTINFNAFTATETFIANNGGNTEASQLTEAGLTGSIRYTYHTPEPACLSILIIGGLALLRRRPRRAERTQ